MRIVIAPDSFKGSLSALAVAEAMERGARAVWADAEVRKVPIADGGEGTVAALVTATQGRLEERTVRGPLGEPVRARWGVLGDGATAVIEMAAASGLPLVPKERRDPRVTTTYGTGELVRAALDAGLSKLVVGIGGSATNDGGAGLARALGARFLDDAGAELPEGGAALARLARVDLSGLDPRLASAQVLVACDVDNPLTGPRGASAVYGPQKGATPEMVQELDAALGHYARVAQAATGRDVARLPGAGAAGGLGAGLLFFTPARLRPGVEIVLETTGFAALVQGADLVLTGEGRTDFQTAMGKAPVGVAQAAKRHGVPVVCLAGGLGDGADDVLAQGIDGLAAAVAQAMPLDEAMARGAELVEAAAARVCRLVELGRRMRR
ncbi:glycerate kinase [Anaeromyxobacter diazotrophicus]|uniref:Glycerate kinase n=1 Tax=Anaeromyxobacter diazotrophicus TaxID=2590199 RepID=A0A7I9VPN3_9BACT|nr:glycerate kinase [Anaeromyxobacter diazotrophicus]GEJ58373.1 glycerate kinase [Anaeromyxobacter diazotrophicus]